MVGTMVMATVTAIGTATATVTGTAATAATVGERGEVVTHQHLTQDWGRRSASAPAQVRARGGGGEPHRLTARARHRAHHHDGALARYADAVYPLPGAPEERARLPGA